MAILAIVVISAVIWQPWAAALVQTNSTTTIRETTEKQVPTSGRSAPIIVNPPAHSSNPPASDTNVTISNSGSSSKDDDKSKSNESNNGN